MLTGRVYSIKTPGNVGSDSNDGLSWNTAFATFEHAIKTAAAGDTIYVAARTYTENIQSSKQLTFKGGYPANGGDTQNFMSNVTILDGGHAGVVLTANANNTVIQGFTVTHGSTGIVAEGQVSDCIITSNDGAGIRGNLTITNCSVTNNSGNGLSGGYVIPSGCTFKDNAGTGAAIAGNGSTVTNSVFEGNSGSGLKISGSDRSTLNVMNCTFRNNSNDSSGHGGGIEGEGTFTNCLFVNNSAVYEGGGIAGEGTLENCTFSGNTAGRNGGGAYFRGTIKNCTFTGNTTSGSGGGIDIHGTVTGCNITGNTAVNGGGVHTSGGATTWFNSVIENSTIASNTASENEGGIYAAVVDIVNCTFTNNEATTGGGLYGSVHVMNSTIINNAADSANEVYTSAGFGVNTGLPALTNTIIYNSSAPYIYNESPNTYISLTLTNCAAAERSIYGAGNTEQVSTVNIADWSASHPAEAVSADNVAHTVFRLKAGDTALIHGGTSEGAPETDQLGNSRDTTHPSIGAVEYSSGSGNSNTTPETPSNEDNSGTSPETPSNDGNGGTSPETPSNDDNGSTTPDTPTESTGGSGGGGCNAFCGLITFAILFTLKRR